MKQNYTIGRMLRPIRRLWLCITFVVLMAPGGYGQPDVSPPIEVQHITTDTTWNTNIIMDRSVVVEPGATLTIAAGGEVYFPPSAKVVVKPGARLVLDSCLLTRRCGDRWQGLEVWGNEELGQLPSSNQGVLVMKNGATISYALTGALAGHSIMAPPDGGSTPPEDRKGGGIIVATDARFENNITGVSFVPYTQHNTSRFLKCTFLNDDLLTPDETFRMALLDNVKNVRFAGCDFVNNSNTTGRGSGIRSYDAQYSVNRYCNALYGDDCIDWKASTFKNLEYGIYALATTPLTHVAIDNTSFILNKRGIYLSGMSLAEVTSNTFEIKGDYGLYLDGCTDYHVEDNYFTAGLEVNNHAGIVVNNSGNDPNEIYRNTFEEVNYGILAQGHNRSLRTGEGLVCKCNEFSLGQYDIVVADAAGSVNFGIARYQGSSAPQPDAPAGNRFSWTGPQGTFTDINNLGLHFTYFYHVNELYHLKPLYYDSLKVTAHPNYNALWDTTSCVSYLNLPGGGGAIEQDLRNLLADSKQQSDSVSQLLQALEDAGNTENLQWEVDMSLPQQSYEIYSELLNTSPYVSDTVMAAAIAKEEVLPDAMIRDVMVANPEAAKSDALLEKLQQRTNPVPEYMLGQILQGRSLISVYGDLMAAEAFYNQRAALAARMLKQIYATDTISPSATDSLMVLLQNEKNMAAQEHLAFCYLQQTDSLAASNALAAIPMQYTLDAQQLAEHALLTDYMNLLLTMQQPEPDSAEVDWLMNATLNGAGPANTFARNLLLAMELIDYDEPVLFPDATKSAAVHQYPYGGAPAEAREQLEVYPNPAADYLIIKWMLEHPDASGTVQIAGLDGRIVSGFPLNGSVGQQVIATSGLKPGVYVVSAFVDKQQVATKKVSIYR